MLVNYFILAKIVFQVFLNQALYVLSFKMVLICFTLIACSLRMPTRKRKKFNSHRKYRHPRYQNERSGVLIDVEVEECESSDVLDNQTNSLDDANDCGECISYKSFSPSLQHDIEYLSDSCKDNLSFELEQPQSCIRRSISSSVSHLKKEPVDDLESTMIAEVHLMESEKTEDKLRAVPLCLMQSSKSSYVPVEVKLACLEVPTRSLTSVPSFTEIFLHLRDRNT